MHILGAILAIILGGAFWIYRLRAAKDAAETLADAANDVRLAARRFGFRRKTNLHPADCVEDPRLAAMGIGAAVVQMQRSWDREASDTLIREAQRLFDVGVDEATEMAVFGRWLSDQSGTKAEIVRRLGKRVMSIAGPEALPDLERLIDALVLVGAGGGSGAPVEDVEDARTTLRRILR